MKALQKIVQDIAQLKPIPRIVNKILEIQQNPDGSMKELARVIAHDAMTTANLLKAANSAYYGRPTAFDSVQQAIVFLGMDEVVDLILMSNSASNLKRPQKGYGLEAGALWRYSAASAMIARDLARATTPANPHLIFTAALLKDIGKVVLEQYVSASAEQIRALVADGGHSFQEAEKAVIGIDHAELGAMVARVWQFSPEMVDVIANHHQPHKATLDRAATVLVHISDVLCMMMGFGGGTDGLAYRFDDELVEEMGLTDRQLQKVMAGFSEKSEEIENLITLN